ncbi:DUF5068 domain-containing protein [Terribacillus sp. 7520-G]|uniref:DUF5068 domain-containing protein n=1 Tax=Terribacillus sp. 7520-G TaxID=2025389 RepID=UPI000BA5D597|nr:DUF5068 domain-containing protein [Terribacillus sp. 7520-G]PAD38487.1 DUF5068 domain-containing protein [Terribacillus sp. 7520-G]
MNKKWMLLFGALLSVFIISGCGADKKASTEEKPAAAEEKAAGSEDEAKAVDTAADADKDASDGKEEAADFAELIDYMKTETDAEEATVLYENTEPQTHEMEGVTVSLDSYSLVELKDFHTDYSIPFNDETNGGVILASYTVKNDTDKDLYYTPFMYMSFTGATKDYNNYKDLIPEEGQLPTKLSPDNKYELKAGETITGTYAYPMGETHLKTAMESGSVTVEVPAPTTDPDDLSIALGTKGQFTIDLSEEGAEKTEANAAFYQDLASVDNMGEKNMIEEKEGIGQSQELGDATVTLDGYQFAEFTPNEYEAPRFENFKNGVVLLTVKFNVDNKGSDNIGLDNMGSNLYVNDGSQYQMSERMLSPYEYQESIAAGESGELLQVFVLDKEQYEKIWKDKAFEIELGPLYDENAEDISKGKKAEFKLK